MITGKQLRKRGWPEGEIIGKAVEAAFALADQGKHAKQILRILDDVRKHPDAYGPDHVCYQLAKAARKLQTEKAHRIRTDPVHAPIWGRSLIDEQAVSQLNNAMRLPVTVGGALMPDAHIGYGIPIGGVVALENAVAPYMVGVDIACRMMMSIYPTDYADDFDNPSKKERLSRIMREETRFGLGAKFGQYERRSHAVLDDPDWDATRQLKHLKDKAHAQLGTSGTGNHFVDAGVLRVDDSGGNVLGLTAGTYLAIMTHSGSRGVGATIAHEYSKLARKRTHLPKQFEHLAWLDMDSEDGQAYWVSMNLAGRFASACHHTIHKAIAKRLSEKPLVQVENHHNFAWQEQWQGKAVIVHRKGATPAHEGVLGIIPGSQGHNSYIVRGLGSEASINSASHGAGRTMSRKQAMQTIPKKERDAWLAERGVELLAGGMDEAPQAYKNIGEVLALQSDLVEPLATFQPRLVLMAGDGKSEG